MLVIEKMDKCWGGGFILMQFFASTIPSCTRFTSTHYFESTQLWWAWMQTQLYCQMSPFVRLKRMPKCTQPPPQCKGFLWTLLKKAEKDTIYTHTCTAAMLYPLRNTLREGIINVSMNINTFLIKAVYFTTKYGTAPLK